MQWCNRETSSSSRGSSSSSSSISSRGRGSSNSYATTWRCNISNSRDCNQPGSLNEDNIGWWMTSRYRQTGTNLISGRSNWASTWMIRRLSSADQFMPGADASSQHRIQQQVQHEDGRQMGQQTLQQLLSRHCCLPLLVSLLLVVLLLLLDAASAPTPDAGNWQEGQLQRQEQGQ